MPPLCTFLLSILVFIQHAYGNELLSLSDLAHDLNDILPFCKDNDVSRHGLIIYPTRSKAHAYCGTGLPRPPGWNDGYYVFLQGPVDLLYRELRSQGNLYFKDGTYYIEKDELRPVPEGYFINVETIKKMDDPKSQLVKTVEYTKVEELKTKLKAFDDGQQPLGDMSKCVVKDPEFRGVGFLGMPRGVELDTEGSNFKMNTRLLWDLAYQKTAGLVSATYPVGKLAGVTINCDFLKESKEEEVKVPTASERSPWWEIQLQRKAETPDSAAFLRLHTNILLAMMEMLQEPKAMIDDYSIEISQQERNDGIRKKRTAVLQGFINFGAGKVIEVYKGDMAPKRGAKRTLDFGEITDSEASSDIDSLDMFEENMPSGEDDSSQTNGDGSSKKRHLFIKGGTIEALELTENGEEGAPYIFDDEMGEEELNEKPSWIKSISGTTIQKAVSTSGKMYEKGESGDAMLGFVHFVYLKDILIHLQGIAGTSHRICWKRDQAKSFRLEMPTGGSLLVSYRCSERALVITSGGRKGLDYYAPVYVWDLSKEEELQYCDQVLLYFTTETVYCRTDNGFQEPLEKLRAIIVEETRMTTTDQKYRYLQYSIRKNIELRLETALDGASFIEKYKNQPTATASFVIDRKLVFGMKFGETTCKVQGPEIEIHGNIVSMEYQKTAGLKEGTTGDIHKEGHQASNSEETKLPTEENDKRHKEMVEKAITSYKTNEGKKTVTRSFKYIYTNDGSSFYEFTREEDTQHEDAKEKHEIMADTNNCKALMKVKVILKTLPEYQTKSDYARRFLSIGTLRNYLPSIGTVAKKRCAASTTLGMDFKMVYDGDLEWEGYYDCNSRVIHFLDLYTVWNIVELDSAQHQVPHQNTAPPIIQEARVTLGFLYFENDLFVSESGSLRNSFAVGMKSAVFPQTEPYAFPIKINDELTVMFRSYIAGKDGDEIFKGIVKKADIVHQELDATKGIQHVMDIDSTEEERNDEMEEHKDYRTSLQQGKRELLKTVE